MLVNWKIFLLFWSSVVRKDVLKKTVYNTLNTEVNNLDKKAPDSSTLIQKVYETQINKMFLKNGNVKNKIPDITG